MSFDLVPVDVVLKIFHQLPLKDRVRLGGVNRLFRNISMESINKMKSLSLTNERDLIVYSIRSTQSFTSLLESCSSTLESIDLSNISCKELLLNSLVEFIYPNLKHLKISITSIREQPKKLLSRCPNLRSIVLDVFGVFEWPVDFVFENLENLEIKKYSKDIKQESILRPLIGNVPKLKRLTVNSEDEIFSMQEFSQLFSSTLYLQELNLELNRSYLYADKKRTNGPFGKMCQDFVMEIPTWRLPMLTILEITLDDGKYLTKNFLIPSSVLHKFPTSFPRLTSITSSMIKEIDHQSIVALSQLPYLRELHLPDLKMTKKILSELITFIPSIEILDISPPKEGLLDLSQLIHLRELHLNMELTKNELIDLISSVPSVSILEIRKISDVDSVEIFIGFLISTANMFHRTLEIRMYISTRDWTINWRDESDNSKMEQMIVSLEEIKNSGGPVVEMKDKYIRSIRNRSLVG